MDLVAKKIKKIKIAQDRKFVINGKIYEPQSRAGIEQLIILINDLIDTINNLKI